MNNRRETDRWICKRLWDAATPWVQVIGFLILCGFYGGLYFTHDQAYGQELGEHEKRLETVEKNFDRIDQKLTDIANFLHVPEGK